MTGLETSVGDGVAGVVNRVVEPVVRFVRRNIVALIVGGVLLWLVGAPIWFLIRMSFDSGAPSLPGEFTLDNFKTAFGNQTFYSTLRNTLLYTIGVSGVSFLIAAAAAWLVERTDMPLRNLAWVLMLLPVAMPGMLSSISWVLLLAPRSGIVNVAIRDFVGVFGVNLADGPFNIFSMYGMIFVEGFRGATTIFLMIVGAFRLMDASLEDAAIMGGAGRLETLRRITIPLLKPALFGALVFAFVGNLQDFDTPLVIGLPANIFVLPTLIYFTAYVSGAPSWGLASAYATLFLVIMVGMTAWYYRVVIVRSRMFTTLTGKGYRAQRIALRGWRYPAFGLFAIFALFAIILPVLVLVWTSLLPGGYQQPSLDAASLLTLENYRELLGASRFIRAAINTTVIAVVTALATMIFAIFSSWAVVRLRVRGSALIDSMAFMPNAIPSVAMGVALIIFYLHPAVNWTRLYGTLIILVIALGTHYLAYATRVSNGAITQISADLEEAAWVSGKGRLFTLRRVTGPLLWPTFLAGALWIMAHAFRNLSLPLLLGTPHTETLSMRLYYIWNRDADFPRAAALGLMMIAVLALMAIGARRLITREPGTGR